MRLVCCRPFLSTLLLLPSTFAVLQTVTVDDTVGNQITYNPNNWNGPGCTTCFAKPDASQAYDSTWHDTTFDPSNNIVETATMSFKGSAVYVYGILTHGPTLSATDVYFFIDGQQVGTYNQPIDNGSGYEYNVLLFQTESLSDSEHTLMIQNGHTGGTQMSLILLDRIVYSFDDGTSNTQTNAGPSSSQNPTSSQNGQGSGTSSESSSQPSQTSSPSSNSSPSSTSSLSSPSLPSPSANNTSSHGSSGVPGTTSVSGGSTQSPNGTTNPSTATAGATTAASGDINSSQAGDVVSSATSNSSHTAVIVGVVVAVIVLILLILLACFLRRRRRNNGWMQTKSDPFVNNMAASAEVGDVHSPTVAMTEEVSQPVEASQPPLTTLLSRIGRRNDATTVVPFAVTPVSEADNTSQANIGTKLRQMPVSRPPHNMTSIYSETTEDTSLASSAQLPYASSQSHQSEKHEPRPDDAPVVPQAQMVQLETALLLAAENQRLRNENQQLRDQQVVNSREEELPPPYLQARA